MKSKWGWDQLGSIASVLCAIHCAISGFAIGLISTVGLNFLASEGAEIAFVVVTLTIGSIAIFSGYRRHHQKWPAALFGFGAFLIGISHFGFAHSHENPISRVVSILGAGALITFHFFNQKLSKAA